MHMAASRHASALSPFGMDLSGRKSLPEAELLILGASSATVSVRSSADVIPPLSPPVSYPTVSHVRSHAKGTPGFSEVAKHRLN